MMVFSIWTILAAVLIIWFAIGCITGNEKYIRGAGEFLLVAALIYIFLPIIIVALIIYAFVMIFCK